MKRERLDRSGWKCFVKTRYAEKRFAICGRRFIAGLLYFDQCTEKLSWHCDANGDPIIHAQNGMKWLTFIPEDIDCAVTAFIDGNENIVEWYIDVIDSHESDPDGVTAFYDAYLDFAVFPNGSFETLDEDELDDAYAAGHLTPEQYGKAVSTGDSIRRMIETDFATLKSDTFECFRMMTGAERYDIR